MSIGKIKKAGLLAMSLGVSVSGLAQVHGEEAREEIPEDFSAPAWILDGCFTEVDGEIDLRSEEARVDLECVLDSIEEYAESQRDMGLDSLSDVNLGCTNTCNKPDPHRKSE